jgi:DNA polymerase-3 subunit gamma/tau
MAHLALYRRYRPKTFSEVIGQKAIVQTLTNALKTNRVSHAYLFCGQRGTGKTTVARLLAKAVNCTNRISINPPENPQKSAFDYEPCNQCESCTEINEGRSLDLIEIDAASNRGIDEIRSLKDGIRFSPVKSKCKVFIIDEVHMLTKEAFNALLKTLEEPPAHAIFILATTEPEKLPATIVSRTQRFDFKKLTIKEIIERLNKLAQEEKIKISDEALREIALSAEGSLRDAESLLDQLISLGYEEITAQTLEEILGRVNFQKISRFLEYLQKNDASEAIRFLNRIYEDGADLIEFSRAVIKNLRKILLLKTNAETEKIIKDEMTEEELKIIIKLSQNFDLKHLQKLMEGFLRVKEEIKHSPIPTLPLEIIVLENSHQ